MKLKKKQKCAAVVLVCCILFQTTYYCVIRPNVVYATGAIGGAAAGAAGGAAFLTGPEAALVIAGLFGITYAVENADALCSTMKAAGNAAVTAAGAAAGAAGAAAAVVEDWWKAATAGVVDTTSAVWDGICNWFVQERPIIRSAPHVVENALGVSYNLRGNNVTVNAVTGAGKVMAVPFFITGQESTKYTQLIVGVFFASTFPFSGYNGSVQFKNYPSPINGMYYTVQSVTNTIGASDNVSEWLAKLGYNADFGDLSFLYSYPFDYSKINEYCLQKCLNGEKGNSITGGLDKALENLKDIDDINFPDTITLSRDAINGLADNVADGVAKAIDNLASRTWTWTDYLEKVASGAKVGAKTAEGVFALDDEGITDIPLDRTDAGNKVEPAGGIKDNLAAYKTDGLAGLFPFCIPCDLINCIKLMAATGQAPCWEFPFRVPVLGLEDTIKIDLTKWDSVAAVCRSLETLLFVGLLINKTRTLIRG